MHPLNSKNFGAGKIKVFFFDGTALTTGYVVKQTGSVRYQVTNGTTTKIVTLATTDALAKRLDGTSPLGTTSDIAALGTMTLSVNGTTKYITKLTMAAAVCTDAGVYSWTLGTPSGTQYAIGV